MSIALNKKARHDYEFLEKFDAGIVLTGAEAKSAKSGGLNLRGAFAVFRMGEAYLTGAQIRAYSHAKADPDYDPARTRKLLLKKKEISRLLGKKEEERLTIIPISAYITKSGRVKITLAVARGRREFEKRATIRKRETEREMRSALKRKK
jgi:SsrA-binding protein